MNCQKFRENLMDVLYGEVIPPDSTYQFFAHLDSCEGCRREYLELIQTRSRLASWELEPDSAEVLERFSGDSRRPWWPLEWWGGLLRVAAALLIIMGAVSMLQFAGMWPDRRLMVSEAQLTQMVHDMVVANQAENWKVIGRALLEAKEEMETRNRIGLQLVGDELQGLERRFVNALEENNRQVRMLVSTQE